MEVCVSHCMHVMARYDVRHFRSIQVFNDNDCGFRALVLRVACTNTSWLSPTTSSRPRWGSGDNAVPVAHSDGGSGRRWSRNLGVVFIMYEMICTSDELL